MTFYDREGRRVTLREWVILSSDHSYFRVAADIENGWLISTVYTGIAIAGTPPLIFETMIFTPDGEIVYQERYPTEAAALGGHDQAISWARDQIRKRKQ